MTKRDITILRKMGDKREILLEIKQHYVNISSGRVEHDHSCVYSKSKCECGLLQLLNCLTFPDKIYPAIWLENECESVMSLGSALRNTFGEQIEVDQTDEEESVALFDIFRIK